MHEQFEGIFCLFVVIIAIIPLAVISSRLYEGSQLYVVSIFLTLDCMNPPRAGNPRHHGSAGSSLRPSGIHCP